MFIDDFIEIEKKYSLYDKSYNGFDYWIYMRCAVGVRCTLGLNRTSSSPKQNTNTSDPEKFINHTNNKRRIGNRRLPKKHFDVLFVSEGRRFFNRGYYESPILDSIKEIIPNSIMLEKSSHLEPKITKDLYFDEIRGNRIYNLLCKIKRCFIGKRFRKKLYDSLLEPMTLLSEKCNISVDDLINYNDIERHFLWYSIKKRRYKKIIKHMRPKIIILEVYYDVNKMIITEIAKQYDIPVIELQHGTAGVNHPAYNYANEKPILQFPNYFFSFSDYWSKASRFPIDSNNVISVGCPYKEKLKSQYLRKTEEKKMILFLSQPVMGEEFAKLAVDLDKLINHDKYYVVYKLHPAEYEAWERTLPCLKNTEVDVIDNKEINLYELLSKAYIQIGACNTTSIYEGLLYNINTCIWNKYAFEDFKRLCQFNYAKLFDDVNELYHIIETDSFMLNTGCESMFWKENSLETMRQEIVKILNISK